LASKQGLWGHIFVSAGEWVLDLFFIPFTFFVLFSFVWVVIFHFADFVALACMGAFPISFLVGVVGQSVSFSFLRG